MLDCGLATHKFCGGGEKCTVHFSVERTREIAIQHGLKIRRSDRRDSRINVSAVSSRRA
jgi:hypothetical protein